MTNFQPATGGSAMEDTQVAAVTPKAPKPKRAPGQASGCLGAIFNLLTLLFVLLTCLSASAVVALFQTPSPLSFVLGGSSYIPATDPALAQVLYTPTSPGGTPGVSFPTLPPVWTPTDTPTITATPMPGTPSPEASDTQAVPTYTATGTATPTRTATKRGPTPKPTITQSKFQYNLQPGTPQYLANFINTSGCNWFGIVGRVFGLDGNPVINLTVHMEGGGINADVVTGSGPSALGPGGYQIPISDHPIDTADTYKVQLRMNTGTQISDTYAVRTFGDCNKNLVLVNFTQNH
jgi:hypothetical protein